MARTCDTLGCENKHLAKGMCYDHYFAAKKSQQDTNHKDTHMAQKKLSPLEEVKQDAKYNYMKRLNNQKADAEYEASKRNASAPAEVKKG